MINANFNSGLQPWANLTPPAPQQQSQLSSPAGQLIGAAGTLGAQLLAKKLATHPDVAHGAVDAPLPMDVIQRRRQILGPTVEALGGGGVA